MNVENSIEMARRLREERGKARFTDLSGSLLPLFIDPDGRGNRRWEQMFGLAGKCEPLRAAGAARRLPPAVRRLPSCS